MESAKVTRSSRRNCAWSERDDRPFDLQGGVALPATAALSRRTALPPARTDCARLVARQPQRPRGSRFGSNPLRRASFLSNWFVTAFSICNLNKDENAYRGCECVRERRRVSPMVRPSASSPARSASCLRIADRQYSSWPNKPENVQTLHKNNKNYSH